MGKRALVYGDSFDLFQLPWYGLRDVWMLDGKMFTKQCVTQKGSKSLCRKREKSKGFPMIQQTIFNGVKICGTA